MARPEVPTAFGLLHCGRTVAGRIAGDSVSDPEIPREGAFCSPLMLHLRRFVDSQENKISDVYYWCFFNDLTTNSSDSQCGNKISDDTPGEVRIIKG
jgi:hypothetical protein